MEGLLPQIDLTIHMLGNVHRVWWEDRGQWKCRGFPTQLFLGCTCGVALALVDC